MAQQPSATDEHRVQFDFEIDFSNGGGIQGQGFRLDIDGDDISDEELAIAIIRDLRLLMVGEVRILNKQIIREPHKRSRGTGEAGYGDGRDRIDLSHVVEDGMVTYPGLPAPVICDFLSREQSRAHYAPGTEFQIGAIELCGNTGTYLAALPIQGFRFSAVPVKVHGMGTFPVRAYATIQADDQG